MTECLKAVLKDVRSSADSPALPTSLKTSVIGSEGDLSLPEDFSLAAT